VALWKRLRRNARTLGISLGCLACVIVLGVLFSDNGFADFMITILTLVFIVTLIAGLAGLNRTGWLYRMLHRHEWSVYDFTDLSIRENMPVTMTLKTPGGGAARYPIRFSRNSRVETLRGIVVPQVWFVGDPERGHGVMTPAGGGEMFRTRPNPLRVATARKPAKPRKVKQLTPAQQRRLAARQAKAAERNRARRAKLAAQAEARAAKLAEYRKKHPAKPAKPRDHRVARGDTLVSIAQKYSCDTKSLAKANGIKAPRYAVHAGQKLKLSGSRE